MEGMNIDSVGVVSKPLSKPHRLPLLINFTWYIFFEMISKFKFNFVCLNMLIKVSVMKKKDLQGHYMFFFFHVRSIKC